MPLYSNSPALSPDNHDMPSGIKKSNAKAKPPYVFDDVKEKLISYCHQHNSAKDSWLMSSHVHCFIVLS